MPCSDVEVSEAVQERKGDKRKVKGKEEETGRP